MKRVILVTGQAGTGKTTWLIRKAKECASTLLTAENQRMLVITRMHGARRRLEMKLAEACPSIPRCLATIDSFALSIVNRWRTTLGHHNPVTATSADVDFVSTPFGIEAEFERILVQATELLRSRTIGSVIGATYPLILIDEFQDCHNALLDFVVALSMHSTLLLAADDFQSLHPADMGRQGIEWVKGLESNGKASIEELTVCHRTSSTALVQAARCLRDGNRSEEHTIPVVCCPNHGPAAWQIVKQLVFAPQHKRWMGTCAVICPSKVQFLRKVLESCATQLAKKRLRPIAWREEFTLEEERKQILGNLGLTEKAFESDSEWRTPTEDLDSLGSHVCDRVIRFCTLRGLSQIPEHLVARHADKAVHERRAYSAYSPRTVVTTVHGAKNREFDNVFVLWPYRIISDQDQQRRLLYNAVTRGRNNCMILVRGNVSRANNDPVLSLMGPAQAAFLRKTGT